MKMSVAGIVVLVIVGIIVLAIILTAIHAAFFTTKNKDYGTMPDSKVDVERVSRHLTEAIQIKTISHEDESQTDWSEFQRFHDFLEREYPLITKNLTREDVSKASLLYEWKGTDPTLKPIAFLSHQDVVPVTEGTEDDWEHPAFSGYNDGENIWGRGALDMKNHLICVMEAVETLLEEGFQPKRTVYLCFGHNEEIVAGDNSGAGALMETLKERGVQLDSIIDEGGAMLDVNVKGILEGNIAGVGVAEKGYADFKLTLKAKGGHSSSPPNHTAIGKLAKAVERLEKHQFKAKLLPFVKDLFWKAGRGAEYWGRFLLCNHVILRPLLRWVMTLFPESASLVRTTTAVTMCQGSPAANVLPQNASVTVNFRIMPGETIETTRKHIEKVIKNKNIQIEYIKGKEPSIISPTDTESFAAIEKLTMQMSSKNIVVPYLVMGGTDAYHYEPICENIYRFAPFTVPTSLLLTTHSTNEHCPIEQLEKGVRFFKEYIREMAGEK